MVGRDYPRYPRGGQNVQTRAVMGAELEELRPADGDREGDGLEREAG